MSTRTALGITLLLAGVLLSGAAGVRYGRGVWRAHEARQLWEEQQAHLEVVRARRVAEVSYRPAHPMEGAPVAHLVIPRIGLDEIVLEGVAPAELDAAPGHLPGSAFPGDPGNAVISAHRDRHFHRMDQLQVGDTILTESGQQTARWVVAKRTIVDRDSPALFATAQPTLTLTTCWPIRYFGPAPQRLLITARPITAARTAEADSAGAGTRG